MVFCVCISVLWVVLLVIDSVLSCVFGVWVSVLSV